MHSPGRRALLACWLGWGLGGQVGAQTPAPEGLLTAPQLVERNAAARGGWQAWHQVQSMVWTGYAVGSADPLRKLPFLLEQQRPQSTRFEMVSEGQMAVRVSSATDGWKMRATASGKPELLPLGPDELRFAQGAPVIDGPLMDFFHRGATITLAGRDMVEGRSAYVLNIQLPQADVSHQVWLDAETFLELRLDRSFRNSAGHTSVSSVAFRQYQAFEGLQIPVVVETGAATDKAFNRLVIERVALNPALDADTFVRPTLPLTRRAGAVTVDTRGAALARPTPRP